MSNGNNGIVQAPQKRIPAWKRLGLQLKYAKDTAEPPPSVSDSEEVPNRSQTRGATEGTSESAERIDERTRPSKRRKLSPQLAQNNGDEASRAHHDVDNTETIAERSQSLSEPIVVEEPTERRKSVTFTTDTKQNDGLSAKTLFKQSTNAGQPPAVKESTETTTPDPSTNADETDPPATKRKKAKKDSNSKQKPEVKELTGVLNYLGLFQNDKLNWKFNKKRQTELLKHVFDIQRIPVEYDSALLDYISGLQGATARTKLIESAFEALNAIAAKAGDIDVKMIESMESSEAKRNAYREALKKYLELSERTGFKDNEWDQQQREILKVDAAVAHRSDEVLLQLLNQELHTAQQSANSIPPPKSQVTSRTITPADGADGANGTAKVSKTEVPSSKPRRKKRKSRTQASSSDDSDSDDSNKGSRSLPTSGPRSMKEALSIKPDIPIKKESSPFKLATGKKTIFDDDFLDTMFPKTKSYHETAPKGKRGDVDKGRGFAYTHGTRVDESESESD